jgi:uncharacterized protein (TIGR02145 family)
MKKNFCIKPRAAFLIGIVLTFLLGCEHEQNENENIIHFNPDLKYGSVTDIDGNVYKTITIGNQTWMAENLRTFRFRDGDIIDFENPGEDENNEYGETEYQCSYKNDESNVPLYGRIYSWHALNDERNIAPVGWHVATYDDWEALINYLGGDAVAGGKLKEAGNLHWKGSNNTATNESGFTALPGGCLDNSGKFWGLGEYSCFYCSTACNAENAYSIVLNDHSNIISSDSVPKITGYYIRCVKDTSSENDGNDDDGTDD